MGSVSGASVAGTADSVDCAFVPKHPYEVIHMDSSTTAMGNPTFARWSRFYECSGSPASQRVAADHGGLSSSPGVGWDEGTYNVHGSIGPMIGACAQAYEDVLSPEYNQRESLSTSNYAHDIRDPNAHLSDMQNYNYFVPAASTEANNDIYITAVGRNNSSQGPVYEIASPMPQNTVGSPLQEASQI